MGVLASLLRRVRTGRGSRVDSSLFSASGVVPRGVHRPVWTVLDRPLRTADGYLVLPRDITPGELAGALGLPTGCTPDDVAARLSDRPTEVWTELLAEADVIATPVCTDLRALAEDPRFERALGRTTHVHPLSPWEFS